MTSKISINTRVGLKIVVGMAFRKLGQKKLSSSDRSFLDALNYTELEPFPNSEQLRASIYIRWSFNAAQRGNYKEALRMLDEGEKLSSHSNSDLAMQRGWRGTFLAQLGRVREAEEQLRQSIDLCRSQSNHRHYCHSMFQWGELQQHRARDAKLDPNERLELLYQARDMFAVALHISQLQVYVDMAIYALRGMADIYQELDAILFPLNYLQFSLNYYAYAEDLAMKTGEQHILTEVYLSLARLHIVKGDHFRAQHYLKLVNEAMKAEDYPYKSLQLEFYILSIKLLKEQPSSRLILSCEEARKAASTLRDQVDDFWKWQEFDSLGE